ncbi:MAG: SDR family oxidoreductase [Anaerolineaceae bacterium]|jgi:NAD(P)H dehydrogenase (quinone)|nr:MAG: SDR family oxidoreductase [Anaerolineaceae bacterium]
MPTITVTGANGHLGRLVVQHLLQKGVNPADLRVSVRDMSKAADLHAQGIDVRHGDFDDFASIRDAFSGSDSVLIISTDRVGSRIEQHLRAVRAAKEAGVKHLAYTSLVKAVINQQTNAEAPLAVEHRATEKAIFESGITYTILRNSFYAEFLVTPVVQALASGVYMSSIGDTPLGCAVRTDYAEAAALVLTQPGHENQVYELTTPKAWTVSDLVQVVQKVSGKILDYQQQVSDTDMISAMRAAGASESDAQMAVGMNQMIRSGMLSLVAPDLEQVLGHAVTSLEDQVRSMLKTG